MSVSLESKTVMEKVVDIVHSDYSCPVLEPGKDLSQVFTLSQVGSLKVMSIKCSS